MTSAVAIRTPRSVVSERVHRLDHVIFWQVRGESTIEIAGGTKYALREHEVLWVPRGTPHSLQIEPNSIVTPLFVEAHLHEPQVPPFAAFAIAESERFFLLALWNSQSTVMHANVNLEERVVEVIEHAANRDVLTLPESAEAQHVAYAIMRDPSDGRRIEEWAATVCTSGRSLERAFLIETGRSFGQWRKACRMFAAARMLHAGEPVHVVSYRVGYENTSSFSRAFREFHGQRPSDLVR